MWFGIAGIGILIAFLARSPYMAYSIYAFLLLVGIAHFSSVAWLAGLDCTRTVSRDTIQYASLHFKEGTLGVSRLDNFEIKRSPAAVRDVFTNGGAGATALDGRQTGAGGKTWAATANLVVRAEDDVSSLGGLSEVGSVPFDPTETNDVVTLSADVNPRDFSACF